MNTPFSVLHFSSATSWRGGEKHLANLLSQSKIAYPQVSMSVFCIEESALSDFCTQKHFTAYNYTKNGVYQINVAKQLSQLCKKHQFDIVHIHDSKSHTIAVLASALFGCKSRFVLHRKVNFPVSGALSKWKYNHSSIKGIITVSKTIEETLKNVLQKGNQNKVTVIYDCVNVKEITSVTPIDIRKELNLSSDSILVGNISALTKEKDYETFFAMAKQLVQQNSLYQFIVLGEGSEKEHLKELVEQLNLSNNVFFLGFKENPYAYLSNFDVFVMTSKQEGLGTSVLEAFACKVPVVSTNAGGLAEVVLNEQTGLSCEVGAAQQLANSVERIIEEKDLKDTLVAKAFQFLNTQFTIDYMTKQTINFYKKIIE